MGEPVEETDQWHIIVDEDVRNSLKEIMQAAGKLRPEGEFSYSDVIRLLLELSGYGEGYSLEELPLLLVDRKR